MIIENSKTMRDTFCGLSYMNEMAIGRKPVAFSEQN